MTSQEHWEKVYATKQSDQVSWYRPHLELSLTLIQKLAPAPSTAIIDVGGGASTLVDDLLLRGYSDLTVLDVSTTAINIAQSRLGQRADAVHWLCSDVTSASLPQGHYGLWHDRAVFHFLADPSTRAAYVAQAASAIPIGGHLIVSTFGPEGPPKCSGLNVTRYDADRLSSEFAPYFRLEDSVIEWHQTPSGSTQQFLCCCFTRLS